MFYNAGIMLVWISTDKLSFLISSILFNVLTFEDIQTVYCQAKNCAFMALKIGFAFSIKPKRCINKTSFLL